MHTISQGNSQLFPGLTTVVPQLLLRKRRLALPYCRAVDYGSAPRLTLRHPTPSGISWFEDHQADAVRVAHKVRRVRLRGQAAPAFACLTKFPVWQRSGLAYSAARQCSFAFTPPRHPCRRCSASMPRKRRKELRRAAEEGKIRNPLRNQSDSRHILASLDSPIRQNRTKSPFSY